MSNIIHSVIFLSSVTYVVNGIMTCHFFNDVTFLLKNYKNELTSKKKKKKPILIQVKPTREILNCSKLAIIFQSKDKKHDIDHGGDDEEEDEDDYNVRKNRTI